MTFETKEDNLNSIGAIISRERIVESLRAHCGDWQIDNLKPQYLRYKPSTNCLIGFSARLAGRSSYVHLKTIDNRSKWLHLGRAVDEGSESMPRDVRVDTRRRIAWFRFPHDRTLNGIESLFSDSGRFLDRLGLASKSGDVLLIKSLAYKPHRRFTAQIATDQGDAFVLKLHQADRFSRIVATLRALQRCPSLNLQVLGKSTRHAAIATPWILGGPLDMSGEPRVDDIESMVDQIQRWPNDAHRSSKFLKVWDPSRGLKRHAEYLSRIMPAMRGRVYELLHRLEALRHEIHDCYGVSHGDLHPRQLITSDGAIQYCDFDNACVTFDRWDIASLLANLTVESLEKQQLPRLAIGDARSVSSTPASCQCCQSKRSQSSRGNRLVSDGGDPVSMLSEIVEWRLPSLIG